MSADDYLRGLLSTYAVNTAAAQAAANLVLPVIEKWANGYLNRAEFSGSIAKGTGVSIGTDADVFLSLSSTTPGTLADMYDTLHRAVTAAGYTARRQNVSVGIQVNGYSIDLVPGRRQSQYGNDHSLYRSKVASWTQTNVATHVAHVASSGRIEEIRILKAWRLRHGLTFPSFYLELALIDGLAYARQGNLAANVMAGLEHIRDNIRTRKYMDPANTNNAVSDDCSPAEKAAIAAKAAESLQRRTWQEVVW